MKKTAIIFSLIFLCTLFLVPFSFAHTLETDGSIGAVMHVNPDDDPVAGESSGFFFEFKDSSRKFKPQDCDCQISILQNGKELYSQSLFEASSSPSLSNPSLNFTFPEKGIYTVQITGTPKQGRPFDPFTLSYTVRVASESLQPAPDSLTQKITENLFVIVVSCSVIIGGSFYIVKNIKS